MPCVSCVVVMGMPPRRVILMVGCNHAAAMVTGHHTAQRITLSFKAASRQRSHIPLGRAACTPINGKTQPLQETNVHEAALPHSHLLLGQLRPAEASRSHPWPSTSRHHYKMRSTSQAHMGVKPTTLGGVGDTLRFARTDKVTKLKIASEPSHLQQHELCRDVR
jgi:hypothetical protein